MGAVETRHVSLGQQLKCSKRRSRCCATRGRTVGRGARTVAVAALVSPVSCAHLVSSRSVDSAGSGSTKRALARKSSRLIVVEIKETSADGARLCARPARLYERSRSRGIYAQSLLASHFSMHCSLVAQLFDS